MKFWVGLGIGLMLASCSIFPEDPTLEGVIVPSSSGIEESEGSDIVLENYGPAPELQNKVWLNTESPLQLVDLRGQVVLIDMWTFG